MLEIITSIRQLRVGKLLQVYEESIQKAGQNLYPYLEINRQLLEAEQDFYDYLNWFLRIPGSLYAVWALNDRYCAALRIEPYIDGVLLTGLETAPDSRRKGYASALIKETLQHLSQAGIHKVYSHISNQNLPSLSTHQKCGFRKISDESEYIDGTKDDRAYTYLFEI